MENATKLNNNDISSNCMTLTANEIANVLGENYKSVAKLLKTRATHGEIKVTEKMVNHRVHDAYIITVSDLQDLKQSFLQNKHLQKDKNSNYLQLLTNAVTAPENAEKSEDMNNDAIIKLYNEKSRNAELTKEIDRLKADLFSKTNEAVRLDADLTVAKSELKYITDKSATMESAYSEQKQKVESLEKVIKSRDLTIIVLGAILLVGVTVVSMLLILGIK